MMRRMSLGPLLLASVLALPASAQPGISTFEQAADLVANEGAPITLSAPFCARFDLACDQTSMKQDTAQSDTVTKSAMVGTFGGGQEMVVLIRRDNDNAKAELYVADLFGDLMRGYAMANNGAPSRLTVAEARAGFEAEKTWWVQWLAQHPPKAAK